MDWKQADVLDGTPSRTTSERESVAPDGDVVDEIERRFATLFRRYRARVRRRAAEIDPTLQPTGYAVLMALIELGPTVGSDLVAHLETDKSTISRQVRALKDLGLITRDRDPKDGRTIVISATSQAIARVRELNAVEQQALRSRLSAWSEQDRADLVRLLTRFEGD